jgi:hypothetical protein
MLNTPHFPVNKITGNQGYYESFGLWFAGRVDHPGQSATFGNISQLPSKPSRQHHGAIAPSWWSLVTLEQLVPDCRRAEFAAGLVCAEMPEFAAYVLDRSH